MKLKATAVGMSSFTLTREGEFSIKTHGKNHCGVTDSLRMYYKLVVRCTGDSLDDRGFLFDQTKVDQWFQSVQSTALSCEQLTIFCGRAVYKLIRHENPKCNIKHFALTLSPQMTLSNRHSLAELTFSYGSE